MMIPVIDAETGFMNPSAIQELLDNNCTMPNIRRVIFNLKTTETKTVKDADGNLVMEDTGRKDKNNNSIFRAKRETLACKPVLATTVEFIDNTKTTVKNSLNDKVELENLTLSDGSNIQVATEAAKEAGVVYAVLKRLIGKVDEKGTVEGNGFGRILHDIVKSGQDERVMEANAKIQKAAAKKQHEELQQKAKSKQKNPSLLETANKLAESQKYLSQIIEKYFADKVTA